MRGVAGEEWPVQGGDCWHPGHLVLHNRAGAAQTSRKSRAKVEKPAWQQVCALDVAGPYGGLKLLLRLYLSCPHPLRPSGFAMFGVRWSGFQGRLIGLGAVTVVGLLALGGVLKVALDTVKIEGPLYNSIRLQKELAVDLSPPALNVRTAYMVALLAADERDPQEARKLVAELRGAEQHYTRRYEKWEAMLPDGPLRSSLRDEVNQPALEFFALLTREFLPAVEGGQREKATAIVRGPLAAAWAKQQRGTENLLKLTDEGREAAEDQAQAAVRFWGTLSIGVFCVVLVVVILATWQISRAIRRPANELYATLCGMASGAGDLTARVKVRGDDEISDLARAINAVLQKLHDLVVSVRESSIQLYAGSTEIAATARQQESTMQNLGASTSEIAAAVKQITATAAELSETMNAVNEGGKETGKLARAGRAGLTGMGSTMTRLADSTDSISGKLSAVRERANDITAVVTTITKVADQTNLLSINAAIEAEKAGESGRGFLVVAREIRRLADQTAVATLDIENMVRQMQGAVSAGVMEMDKFTGEVRAGVGRVGEINSQMGQILEQVHALNDRFQGVNEAMGQQSGGARQINDAMLTLVSGVQETSTSLREFHEVTASLRDAADNLKTQVSKFKVAG